VNLALRTLYLEQILFVNSCTEMRLVQWWLLDAKRSLQSWTERRRPFWQEEARHSLVTNLNPGALLIHECVHPDKTFQLVHRVLGVCLCPLRFSIWQLFGFNLYISESQVNFWKKIWCNCVNVIQKCQTFD